ncbi:MAG TPA: lamin tail domain-containing protein [Gaiellaceae bacterium]|nr:lamin tail domain-containing protein [Gaiellaceae bacterium]
MHAIRLALALLCAAVLLEAPAAVGASSDVVVSQLYAGGGNAGAAYLNDYVELLNRGAAAVDVTGWSVQYATAAGTSWQATALAGSLQPGRRYLVQLASGGTAGAALPAPDATGTTNLAASGGKVALVRDAAALSCGASAGSCSANPLVADLVGYGSASDYEGSGPAPALSATTAAVRADGGCTDTDANAADFAAGPPAPGSSASPAASCAGAGTPSATASAGAAVDLDVAPAVSIALDRPSLSFGAAAAGTTPAALAEHVTVLSNDAAGYSLTVRRSAFAPADLPLGVGASAPAGGALGPALSGGGLAPVPVPPAADLLVGTASAPSAAAGDVWTASVGFAAPLPAVAAGHYSATVTFTVVGR